MNLNYGDYVNAQTSRNPCLKSLAEFFDGSAGHQQQIQPIKFSSVNFSQGRFGNSHSWEFRARDSVFDLASFQVSVGLESCQESSLEDIFHVPADAQGRVVIIEDMDRHIASFLGSRFDISPFFFANHLDNSFSKFEKQAPLASLTVPSIHCKGNSVHLHYRRVINLGATTFQSLRHTRTNSNISRSVTLTAPLSSISVGWSRSCCSIMRKQISEDQWICLIFVDPPYPDVCAETTQGVVHLKQKPLHGGPKLESEIPEFSSWRRDTSKRSITSGMARSTAVGGFHTDKDPSLRDTLIQCFHQPFLDFDMTDPSVLSLAYWPIQIVISEWNFYTMLLSRYVKHYEYALISCKSSVQLSNLEELLPWRRRCVRSQQRLHLLRVFIDYHLQHDVNKDLVPIWKPIQQDIDHLSSQISDWASFLGSMITQLDTHQALIEARNVRRFTYVVLAFTALSLVTSIFSMTDEVLPWVGRFWMYFVIAIPFTLIVLLGYFTVSRNLGRA